MSASSDWTLNGLLRHPRAKFGCSTPFKLQVPGLVQWHTSGAEHVQAFFKSKDMSGNIGTIIAMEKSFGMPRQSVDFYSADDGGNLPNPRPGSTVKREDRVMYEIHKLVNTNLSGESLIGITSRFKNSSLSNLPKPTRSVMNGLTSQIFIPSCGNI